MENQRSTMSDNQRRFVCRMVFLLLGLLPTSIALYSIFHKPGPKEWQRLIQAELGVVVSIESVETPTLNMTILRGVRFSNNNASDLPGLDGRTIEQIAIVHDSNTNKLIVRDPFSVDSKELANLVSNCKQRLSNDWGDARSWRVRFSKILLNDSDASEFVALNNVRLFADASTHGSESKLKATVIADILGDEECTVKIDAVRSENVNSVTVETNDGFMPSHLLKHFSEFAICLGSQCQFSGKIESRFIDGYEDQPSGRLSGQLVNVQLDKLAQFTDRNLVGTCDIEELNLDFDEGQIVSAGFRAVAKNAITVDRKFLDEAFEIGVLYRDDLSHHSMVKLAKLDMNLSVKEGQLFLSSPTNMTTEVDTDLQSSKETVLRDAIVLDENGEALVVCDSKRPIESYQFAKFVVGSEVLDSHSFNLFKLLQGFKAHPRIARNQDATKHY